MHPDTASTSVAPTHADPNQLTLLRQLPLIHL